MAKRKKSYNPNQFSLFDYFRAPQTVRDENIIAVDVANPSPHGELENEVTSNAKPEPTPPPQQQYESPQTSVREEPVRLLQTVINLAPSPEPVAGPSQDDDSGFQPQPVEPESLTEPVRLGINDKGGSVYLMPDGSRMHSANLGLLRVVDGDKLAPDVLYRQNRHEFLTIQEVAHFKNETDLRVEETNVRQTDRPSGNRKNSSQAGNDSGREVGGGTPAGAIRYWIAGR